MLTMKGVLQINELRIIQALKFLKVLFHENTCGICDLQALQKAKQNTTQLLSSATYTVR